MSTLDATAYDSFGRILAAGGEQTYALGLARGYPGDRLSAIMLRRFGNDYTSSSGLLGWFVEGMLLGANRVNAGRADGGSISLQDVPNNPFIDETETGGNLFRWSADVEFEGGRTPVTVYGYSSSTDIERLVNEAVEGGMGIADQYRGKFGLSPDDSITPTKVTFLTMESTIPNGSTTN
jgi:hypothetical protein